MMAERSSMWPFCMWGWVQRIQQNLMRAFHFILQIKLRVQLLIANLLIKKINNQNMRTGSEHVFSYDDFENCKWKLFTENGGLGNDVETDKGSNWQSSAAKKSGTATEYKSPPNKKIKLKQHLKTEQHHPSPQKIDKARMKTSPNHHTPLQEKNLNLPNKNPFKHKTNLTDFFPISEVQPRNMHNFKTLYSELYPSPKKRSLPYSSIHKESIHIRQASKSQERSLSKSKKKIHFTVFQTKERSKGKSPVKKQPPPKPRIDFLVPYRQHASITINLFESKENKEGSKSKPKRSNSKESIRSRQKRQRRSRQSSLQKKPGVSKTLVKSISDYEQDERVKRTLQRLEKYRFVGQYIELWEIVQKIAGYTRSNEPQCKWPLLIVDEVFKRIRQDNKFEALVSK